LSLSAPGFGQQAGKAVLATTPEAPTVSSPPATPVRTPETPEQFLARARQLTDLEASRLPFHLKATFIASGHAQFTGKGTYEEWWQSKDDWRVDAVLKNYRLVEIEQGGKLRVWSTASYIPLRLRQVLDQALVRIGSSDAGSACTSKCKTEWKKGRQRIQGTDFIRLTYKYPCATWNSKPVYCMSQYYFAADGTPRIYANEALLTIYNDIQNFQNVEAPHSISVSKDGKAILDISIQSLEPLQPNRSTQINTIPQLPRQYGYRLDEGRKTLDGKLLMQLPIQYPAESRTVGTQGTVVLGLTVDEKGKVREPYVLVSAGQLLDDAAVQSIMRWKYRPATVDGEPVSVNTTIAVDFSLTGVGQGSGPSLQTDYGMY
jgi:TonB family protein